jgi:hypothetical protein
MTKRIIEWEKNIRIWVTLKRLTNKIRSGCGPLIRDYENGLGNWAIGWIWIGNWWFEFWGNWSKKGSTRKTTENRVTRWRFLYLGESWVLCWITKELGFGILVCLGIGRVLRGWCEEGGQTVFLQCIKECVVLGLGRLCTSLRLWLVGAVEM